MKKVLLAVTLAAVLSLCACVEEAEEVVDLSQRATVETAKYSFLLPKNCAAEQLPDGGVRLSQNGKEIGGVQAIPFDRVEELDAEAKLGRPFGPLFDRFKRLVIPKGMGYMADSAITTKYSFLIGMVSDAPETRSIKSTFHYYFPAGDQFYDLWFLEQFLGEEEETLVVDSFTVKE